MINVGGGGGERILEHSGHPSKHQPKKTMLKFCVKSLRIVSIVQMLYNWHLNEGYDGESFNWNERNLDGINGEIFLYTTSSR